MAKPLIQKTFKIALQVTVSMDEVGEEHLPKHQPAQHLFYLKRLQKALQRNEPTLVRQMLAAVFSKLQAYSDYLAGQDTLAGLAETAAGLGPEERIFFATGRDSFADLTRAVRVSCLSATLDSSAISEKASQQDEPCGDRPVWRDLQPESELGRQLASFQVPAPAFPTVPGPEDSHFLLVRYLTQQADGVHLEGGCACGAVFEGLAEDEERALERLWRAFRKHTTLCAQDTWHAGLLDHWAEESPNGGLFAPTDDYEVRPGIN